MFGSNTQTELPDYKINLSRIALFISWMDDIQIIESKLFNLCVTDGE